METLWFIIVAIMIAAYVVLDGFDLGVGIIYLIVGKTGDERRRVLRGIGIELRAHMNNPVWQGFFEVIFSVSSALLAIFFGAALGNVIRGVPLGADGYFFEALWTNFRLGPHPGILDWYTVMAGVMALIT